MRIIALAVLLAATPAAAATSTTTHAKPAVIKPMPDPTAMLAIFDKLFPPQPDPDPARLALARTAVVSMWPDGAYARMMTGIVGNMFDGAMKMRTSDLASLDSKAAKAPLKEDPSIHELAAAKDPYFDQRITAIRAVVTDEMDKMSALIDPRMRDGMARAMARRFDAKQLADIDAFLATPSGHAFAGQYVQLMVDPDSLRSMFSATPELIKLMPDMMEKIKAADAKFPRPKPAAKADKH
jgi:hypothetical protein